MLFVSLFIILAILGAIMVIMDEQHVGVSDLAITSMTLLGMFSAFQGIINAVRMLSDRPIRYRLSIPFVK